jgi:UDPglucose 6-dehydrogenase
VSALARTAREYGQQLRMLEAVEAVNEQQKSVLLDKIFDSFGDDLEGKTFAIWGLAFKPNTDDMREAPSRVIIAALLRAGATVVAHDPVATEHASQLLARDLAGEPETLARLSFAGKPMDAVQGAHALVVVTEWKAYRSPNLRALKAALLTGTIFDGRNLYDPYQLAAAGLSYLGVGRNNLAQLAASRTEGPRMEPELEAALVLREALVSEEKQPEPRADASPSAIEFVASAS